MGLIEGLGLMTWTIRKQHHSQDLYYVINSLRYDYETISHGMMWCDVMSGGVM